MTMKSALRNEKYLLGNYDVPNTRFEIPRIVVQASDVYRAIKDPDAATAVPTKVHKETLAYLDKAYRARVESGESLSEIQLDTHGRIVGLLKSASSGGSFKFNKLRDDQDIQFALAMLSTWMRGTGWSKISQYDQRGGIIPELLEKVQDGMPISFYMAMSKTGPYESTVNTPDLAHLLHMARLGALLQLKGGSKEIHIIDEYEGIRQLPGLLVDSQFWQRLNSEARQNVAMLSSFSNSEYRKTFMALVSPVVSVSFRRHPNILEEVFYENIGRFETDRSAPELEQKRRMFARGMPLPPDELVIPLSAYLEGSKPKPTDAIHTSLIHREGGLLLALTHGYAPIHGVSLIWPSKNGHQKIETFREIDIFAMAAAVKRSPLSVSAVWMVSGDNAQGPRSEQFLGYVAHRKSNAPTSIDIEDALKEGMRESSMASASGGVHNMVDIVSRIPDLTDAQRDSIISRLPNHRQ